MKPYAPMHISFISGYGDRVALVFRLLQKRVIALSGTARSFREPMENFTVAAARNGT